MDENLSLFSVFFLKGMNKKLKKVVPFWLRSKFVIAVVASQLIYTFSFFTCFNYIGNVRNNKKNDLFHLNI